MRESHLRFEINHAIAICICHCEVFLFRNFIVFFGVQIQAVRCGTPIAKRLVPDMLFAGIMLAIFIGLIVWLGVSTQLFVQIIIDGLVIKHRAHRKFRNQLWVIIASRGVKPTFGRSGMFDH